MYATDSLRDALEGVDFVFHAAALKQVPSCEFYPHAGAAHQCVGTENVMNAAPDGRREATYRAVHRQGRVPHQRHGYLEGHDGEAGRRQVPCGLRRGPGPLADHGNVMASRGSVIPLFVRSIARRASPLTITDPSMTRFLMSIADTLELVLYSFEHGAPATSRAEGAGRQQSRPWRWPSSSSTGARTQPVIGSRHGEKLYETLLTREEMLRAEDMGDYFRVVPDDRDLNYDLYFTEGVQDAGRSTTTTPTTRRGSTWAAPVRSSRGCRASAPTGPAAPRAGLMRGVVVTGAGLHRAQPDDALARRDDVEVVGFDVGDPLEGLTAALAGAEVVYHLAGVNRPRHPQEFETGNAGFTEGALRSYDARPAPAPRWPSPRRPRLRLDNPYGASKLAAENALGDWSRSGGGAVAIFRLANVFGKWGRPEYNSVTATFCYNIAHGLPLRMDDPSSPLRLMYVGESWPRSSGSWTTRSQGWSSAR